MVVKIDIPVSIIRYAGLFQKEKLLRTVRGWLLSERYLFSEPKHKYSSSPTGATLEVRFEGDRKVTSYVRFKIVVDILINEMKDVQVVKDGIQTVLQEGKILIETKGTLELDWQNRFGGSKFLQGLHDFYLKYIIKKKIDEVWWGALYSKIFKLNSVIREAIGFETV
ncbi:MAG: hypothetical protein QXU88_00735, partial [Candidatus Woesearchaeota archaeon]